ncbi:nuclear transport factor 2 family protein [Dactylosporangium sp. NPDC005572]|uniref:nuclear transport factor 2 family protein n=1 Tax=Dactylosporangium sp. NPDC005572 TaxID=3156889 RepID=UPI0033A987E3
MTTMPEAVRAVFDATNAEDDAAFVAAFSADGVIDDWGREFHGHEAIGRWNDGENIGVHARLEPTGVTEHDGAHVVTATVSGAGFNGPSHFTFRLTADGRRVSRMTIRE